MDKINHKNETAVNSAFQTLFRIVAIAELLSVTLDAFGQ